MKFVFVFALLLASFLRPALNSSIISSMLAPEIHGLLAVIEPDLQPPNTKSGESSGLQNTGLRAQSLDVVTLAFGILMLLILLWLNVLIPDPTPSQFFIFRASLALAACAICIAAPGFIAVDMGYGIRATGALAVFLLVYIINPAKLIKN